MTIPRLDYFFGRPVTKITSSKDGGWTINLEGGVRITNHNKDRERPEALKDYIFVGQEMSGESTVLKFVKYENNTESARASVTVDPKEYSISTPDYNEGEEVFPQQSDHDRLQAQQEIEDARPDEPVERLPEAHESPQEPSEHA